jgi:hypothetical protein
MLTGSDSGESLTGHDEHPDRHPNDTTVLAPRSSVPGLRDTDPEVTANVPTLAPMGCLALGSTRLGEYHSSMTVLHSPPGREARFTALYVRLVSGLARLATRGQLALPAESSRDGRNL